MPVTTYTAQQVLSASTQGLDLGAAVILDSSANVLSDLDALEPLAAAGKIGSVSFTDATAPTFSLQGTQAVGDLQVLSLFQGGYSLQVSTATVAQAEQLVTLPHVSIEVSDLPSTVLATLDTLQSIAGSLSEIQLPPTSPYQTETSLTLTQAQLADDAAAIAKISSILGGHLGSFGVTVTVSGTFTATAAVAAEALNGYIDGLTVVDSLANLETSINSAPNRPNVTEFLEPGAFSAAYQFSSITLTDSGTPTIVLPFNNSSAGSTITVTNADGFLAAITNPHYVNWTGVAVDQVSSLLDTQQLTPSKPSTLAGIEVSIQDTAVHVASAIDYLETYDLAREIQSIAITDATLPTFTAAQLTVDASVIAKITVTGLSAGAAVADAGQLQAVHGVTVQDSAANVAADLDGLNNIAAAGKLGSITLTDSSTPTLTIGAAQLTSDAPALADIKGGFQLDIAATAGVAITGMSGVATTVEFLGNEADCSFTAAGDGSGLTVSDSAGAYQVSSVQALQFADGSVIVAATPGPASAVTTGNMAELYGAVFGREPDVGGLAFYQAYMAKSPATPLLQYAEWFLASPEYTGNPLHTYAQTVAGDQQFISDSYQNLLHRTPSADEVAFYENNVIAPALNGLQAGTPAFAAADLAAHALTLVYFSASAEFLSNVQVTASTPASAQHWLVLV